MRYSRQREIILNTVRERKTHLIAKEIYDDVKEKLPNISLGTVYRNLNALSEYGLIRKIEMPQGSDQFDFTLTPHSHMYCTDCKRVFDIKTTSIDEMKSIIEKENGYQITSTNMVLEGICKDCQNKK